MTLFRGAHALGKRPVASVNSTLVCGLVYEYITEATALAAGDIIELGNIEIDVKPVDVMLVTDKLDTNGAPTIQLSVGILNAAKTDIDAAATSAWITATNAAKTSGIERASNANAFLSGRGTVTRILGAKVVTAPATWVGAGKKLAVVLSAAG